MDDTMYDTLEEEPTLRKVVDCRDQPSVMDCSVKISADTDEEVLEAAVQHAISKHWEQDSPELREQIRSSIKEEME